MNQDDTTEATSGGLICPNCGRVVEAGFRFCDGCGTKLDPATATPAGDERRTDVPKPAVETAGVTEPVARHDELSETPAPQDQKKTPHRAEEPAPRRLGFAARLTRKPDEETESQLPRPQEPGVRDADERAETGVAESGRRFVIASRLLRRQQAEQEATAGAPEELRSPAASTRPMAGRAAEGAGAPAVAPPVPVAEVEEKKRRPSPRNAVVYVLHLLAAFVAGAILLGIVAAAASMVSEGRVALLEFQGLPIFIGGATAIVIFALLRTSGAAVRPGGSQRGTVVAIFAGFVALVVASSLLYQPAIGARVQERLDRALQVYGSEDEQAVNSFASVIDEWNEEAARYRGSVEGFVRGESDGDSFRADVTRREGILGDLSSRMRTHADAAQHSEIGEGMRDLISSFEDRVSGLRLVSRGLLINDLTLVRAGDERFKAAGERAQDLFSRRLLPVLERAGIEPEPLESALSR